jgi:hypothetical protein
MRLGFMIGSALLVASPAAAQICAGFPTVDRQFSFGGSLDFPEGSDQWGVEASYNAQGPLSIFGGMDVNTPEGADDANDIFFLGVAMDLLSIDAGNGADALSVCPTGRIGYDSRSDRTIITIPIGVGIGTTLQVAPSVPLMPYVVPQLVFQRSDPTTGDTSSDTNFGIRAGALVGFGMIYVGPEVEHLFREGADPVFGIRAGIRL